MNRNEEKAYRLLSNYTAISDKLTRASRDMKLVEIRSISKEFDTAFAELLAIVEAGLDAKK